MTHDTLNDTPQNAQPKRVAVYVDELKSREGRREELTSILSHTIKTDEKLASIIIYGSPKTDANVRINKLIETLEVKGTTVTFIQEA